MRTVASVPCQEYIKDKTITHAPASLPSNLFLFCFFSQRSHLPFQFLYCIYIVVLISEAYSEPCQTSKMEFFPEIVNSLNPLTIFQKKSIVDI